MREYNAAKELVFLTSNLKRIGYEELDVNTLLLLADNQAAIKLAINPVNYPHAKHIDIQYHKLRELINNNDGLEFDYIPTEEMVADGLTKLLTLTKHEYFITMLGLGNNGKKWPRRDRQQTWMGVLVIRSRWRFYQALVVNLTMLCMRSISADSLRHGHAPSLLILFLCYLENQSNPRLISPCKFLMINLVMSSDF